MTEISQLDFGGGAIGAVAAGMPVVSTLEGCKALLLPGQTHSCNVATVTGIAQTFPETDALITQLRGIAIGIRTADCVPLLLYAPDIEAVAAIHAGWRGSLHGITTRTIDALKSLGAAPEKIRACFGPAICGECYEVDAELARSFTEAGFGTSVIHDGYSKPHIDLVDVNRRRLIAGGVMPGNIAGATHCTLHSTGPDGKPLYHSWRRTPGTPHRNITLIYMP